MPLRPVTLLIGLAAGVCAAAGMGPSVTAQTTPPNSPPDSMQRQGGADPEQGRDENTRGVLSTEERDLARRAAREDAIIESWQPRGDDPDVASGPQAIVGEPLPPDLAARRAPESLVSNLPSRPEHEYWIFENNLALVDKENREVTDIVRDIFEPGEEAGSESQ